MSTPNSIPYQTQLVKPPTAEIVQIGAKGGSETKVQRYKWLHRNSPGVLRYVDKRTLFIDRSYQRELNTGKSKRIASNLNWAAFGVLVVAERADKKLVVVDGQHRLAAALSRADVSEVPVVIFDLDGTIQDEATDFLVVNKERKPLTSVESFKALLASGDATALRVQEYIRQINREAGRASSTTVACVNVLYRCVQRDEDSFAATWPLIGEISEGQKIDNRIVTGMVWLERKLVDPDGNKRSLADATNRKKLIEAGYRQVLRAIGEAAAYYKRGGDVVFANGVLNLLNYRRSKKLEMKG
jgi:hypothetical protein